MPLYPKKQIFKRYEHNPILGPKDSPWELSGIYNCGVIKHKGEYLMSCRVESIDLTDHFVMARSKDGIHFTLDAEPIALPEDPEFRQFTNEMIYDPRIVYIAEDDAFYLNFACHSSFGVRIGQLKSRDLKKFEWIGFGSGVDNRNSVLFPEKIDGMYVRYDRPSERDIWLSRSPDLRYWGDCKLVLRAVTHSAWAKHKVGAGATPIRTPHGWLVFWHGVHVMSGYKYVYHTSAMLTDLKEPWKVLACCKAPLLSPTADYEQHGLNSHVAFGMGAVLEDDGEIKLYYGGADTVECLATARLEDVLDACYNR
jgi:predicted GH43/DUF377 family glycosyl hydrolase